MSTGRMEAFSDGVIAILITIMVLELKVPDGTEWADLRQVLPRVFTYLLSFVYLGIYWNNHHHMLQVTEHVSGGVLWANLHLLFWLSLVPFTTDWMGEHHWATVPTAVYGITLLAAAIAYFVLQTLILRSHGPDFVLARALGRDWKGKLSPVLYLTGILATFADRWVGLGFYVLVALIWLVPDRRVERALTAG
jgi:uncharacterized membrane protein